ncbi:BAHD acyltransferase [Salix suchowensis]|nr:BAHD acyltransferase [Salix suchowensis]
MAVEIITREAVKPSSPPLITYEILIFLPAEIHGAHKSERLKRSLSETLSRFYPFAGRIKDDASIECNDFGAVFVEARVSSLLSEFLEKPDAEVIRKFIPAEIESPEELAGSLVLVQANFFPCGGLAIGVRISHKVADPVTFCTFIKAWAAAAFVPATPAAALEFIRERCVTKRLVFDASKIAALQVKAASESVQWPTRVEAVTALIWKCAMNASRSNSEHLRYSILSQPVNLRRRVVPPLPEHTIGNLVGYFASCATECEVELQSLVGQIRKGLRDFGESYMKKLGEDKASMAICESFQEAACMLQEGNADFYVSNSFCSFPFYGIDFGWGKPTWVTIPAGDCKNVASIMDAKDGEGIEAWVTLTEDDMAFFERDRELLAAASLDPIASDLIMPMSSL